ncbi:hypothetical protein [Pararhizobium haloflavum]|uniref:hypothetical protein n=1 Tax=Pararhizobium haloflavum TaxID=2037914 RepID=UPI000C18A6E4|nr:hypothetical protein [Pararhizobium haloflavum]
MDNVARPAEPVILPKPVNSYALDLIEFEMALDSVQPATNGFAESVRQAVESVNGAFLFDLPASGLVEGSQKIAAVHMPIGASGAIVFVLLSEDGTTVKVEMPAEATADLARFAEAFVALHQRL